MISRLLSNWFLGGLFDFALLAGTGIGVWWLVDQAVPAEWCAGGRWDAAFIYGLALLFATRNEGPAWGRRPWPRRALMIACAAVATPLALMTARLLADCGDVEGEATLWIMLPQFLAGLAIGLATLAAYLLMAKYLPATENRKKWRRKEPRSVGGIVAFSGGITAAVIFLLAWPDLVDAAATALLDGYCPARRVVNVSYVVIPPLLVIAVRPGGRAAWRRIAITALAALAITATADVVAGLAVTCPPAGEDLTRGQGFLRNVIRAAGIGIATALIFQLNARRPAGDDGQPGEEAGG